jgi:hypothetical protein
MIIAIASNTDVYKNGGRTIWFRIRVRGRLIRTQLSSGASHRASPGVVPLSSWRRTIIDDPIDATEA